MKERYKISDAISAFKHWALTTDGKLSDDLPVSDLAITRKLVEARAQVISQYLEMGVTLSKEVEQTLDCVSMEEVPAAEAPCAPPSGCTWRRTVTPLPSDLIIRSVTGMVAGKDNPRFSWIEWDKFQYVQESRLAPMRKARWFTLRDTGEGYHLYLYNEDFLEKITITGIWSNPIEAAQYPKCGKINTTALCFPKQVPFHIDRKLANLIFETAIQIGLTKRQFSQTDVVNDDQAGNIGANAN